jgi:hypothetical protein
MKKLFSLSVLLLSVQTFGWEPELNELKSVKKNFCSALSRFYEAEIIETCTGKLFFVDPSSEIFLPKGTKYRIMSSAIQLSSSETVYDCTGWVREDLTVELSDCDIQY